MLSQICVHISFCCIIQFQLGTLKTQTPYIIRCYFISYFTKISFSPLIFKILLYYYLFASTHHVFPLHYDKRSHLLANFTLFWFGFLNASTHTSSIVSLFLQHPANKVNPIWVYFTSIIFFSSFKY